MTLSIGSDAPNSLRRHPGTINFHDWSAAATHPLSHPKTTRRLHDRARLHGRPGEDSPGAHQGHRPLGRQIGDMKADADIKDVSGNEVISRSSATRPQCLEALQHAPGDAGETSEAEPRNHATVRTVYIVGRTRNQAMLLYR